MTSNASARVSLMVLAATLGVACGGDDGREPGLKDRTGATGAQELRKVTLEDQKTVAALASKDTPGRVVYDAPVDLSYANAVAKRPDLTNLDTIKARAAAAAAAAKTAASATAAQTTPAPGPQPGASGQRDKTGGDASTDTSGGAARRPKP